MSSINRLPEIPPEIMEEAPSRFKTECFAFHNRTQSIFEEAKFNGFVKKVLDDPVLQTYFVYSHFFHIYNDHTPFEVSFLTLPLTKELLTPELHSIFLDRMKELKNDYFPYTLILWDLFEATWVSCTKKIPQY